MQIFKHRRRDVPEQVACAIPGTDTCQVPQPREWNIQRNLRSPKRMCHRDIKWVLPKVVLLGHTIEKPP